MYDELINRLRDCSKVNSLSLYKRGLMEQAADAIEERCQQVDKFAEEAARLYAKQPKWIPVTERLPACEWGAEVGNIEWISHGYVSAGCFGRGGIWRDAYFRTWTDATEGMDAKDAECWRIVQLPKPPKEINQEERDRELCRSNYAAQLDGLGYNADGTPKEVIK